MTETQKVYSQITMCLRCKLIVEMVHEKDADPVTGHWECPKCGCKYPFADWKIRRKERT